MRAGMIWRRRAWKVSTIIAKALGTLDPEIKVIIIIITMLKEMPIKIKSLKLNINLHT